MTVEERIFALEDRIRRLEALLRVANCRLPVNHRVEDDTISQREAV